MKMNEAHAMAVKKIRDRGMIVHPKCETAKKENGEDAIVILAAFFAQEGCIAVSISGLEMLMNNHPDLLNGLLDARVKDAFDTLRTRVLEQKAA